MNRPTRMWLYPAVFSGGFASLAVELSATRLIGPAFGTSNAVWEAVIGLILLYLTMGYYIGGLTVGRWGLDVKVYYTTLLSAVAIIAIPVMAPVTIDLCAGLQAGAWLGALLSVAILFGPAIVVLGCISPLAVQAAVTAPEDAGQVAGGLYATSTLGSLTGAFLPVLWWLPEWGTTRTFAAIAAIQAIIGAIGLGIAAVSRSPGQETCRTEDVGGH